MSKRAIRTSPSAGRPRDADAAGLDVGVDATMEALARGGFGTDDDVAAYFEGVARARYVMRRTFRIFNEAARDADLESLHHQALIQIVGSPDGPMPVSRLAERLDTTASFASRLVQDLEGRGLVRRSKFDADRRVSLVEATVAGHQRLSDISAGVRAHMTYFQSHLSERDRAAALSVMAFYVGVPQDAEARGLIRRLVASAEDAESRRRSEP